MDSLRSSPSYGLNISDEVLPKNKLSKSSPKSYEGANFAMDLSCVSCLNNNVNGILQTPLKNTFLLL